jgi:DinB superfamily
MPDKQKGSGNKKRSIRRTGKDPMKAGAQTPTRRTTQQSITDLSLRRHLVNLLKGEGSHAGFDAAFAELPIAKSGLKTAEVPYSAWQLLEHMRIAQWDILEFSRNPKHVSPKWPEGYWPSPETPLSETAWAQSVKDFRRDLKAMQDLVSDPSTDLFARIPHGEGQTILREALLVADHNSYHLGQLVLVRRLLGEWSD